MLGGIDQRQRASGIKINKLLLSFLLIIIIKMICKICFFGQLFYVISICNFIFYLLDEKHIWKLKILFRHIQEFFQIFLGLTFDPKGQKHILNPRGVLKTPLILYSLKGEQTQFCLLTLSICWFLDLEMRRPPKL